MADFIDFFGYGFVQRGLIAGVCVAVSCSALGVFLVLRRLSLIGEGLAHASLATIGLGLILGWAPLLVSVPLIMLASLFILWLSERANVYADAAIGLVSAMGIAIGVILATRSGGSNNDLMSYLFGDVLSVEPHQVWISAGLALLLLALVVLFYHELFILTFEEDYARVLGIRTGRINVLLLATTALAVVLGIKIVGTMLVSSLIIFPAVTALQVARGFRGTILLAMLIGIVSVVLGIVAAYLVSAPTGPVIVVVNGVFFAMAYVVRRITGR